MQKLKILLLLFNRLIMTFFHFCFSIGVRSMQHIDRLPSSRPFCIPPSPLGLPTRVLPLGDEDQGSYLNEASYRHLLPAGWRGDKSPLLLCHWRWFWNEHRRHKKQKWVSMRKGFSTEHFTVFLFFFFHFILTAFPNLAFKANSLCVLGYA